MPTKKELIQQAKELEIRGYSKMNKAELESAIFIKQVSDWYDDISSQTQILIDPQEIDINQDIILLDNNETSQC
jgi:hypothetical protein